MKNGKIIKVANLNNITCLATPKRVIGRKIVKWSSGCGSYGQGGPGFFGLYLGGFGEYPSEWLILTLWGAANWLHVNGRPLMAEWMSHGGHLENKLKNIKDSLFSAFFKGDIPEVTTKLSHDEDPALREIKDAYFSSLAGYPCWDKFSPLILGKEITRFEVEMKSTLLIAGEAAIILNKLPSQRSLYPGTGEPRALKIKEDLHNAWIITQHAGIEI